LLEAAAQAAREAAAAATDTVTGILQAHGGTLDVSKDGFRFELPLAGVS
ncbi:MAG: hypothetical protein H7Z10_12185, partial [Gemmatimonadaceae bacterium]|nr:hypothetical protein [Acetobacteraceae bacterium]